MSAATQKSKNRLSASIEAFKAKSGADKRRAITDMLFNNAMYIIILIAVIYIAIRVPEFISTSSIVNIVSLTAAKLPIALGIAGAIVLTGTDICKQNLSKHRRNSALAGTAGCNSSRRGNRLCKLLLCC